MKCAHCSTPLTRTDWFCPNCRRGIRKPQRNRRAKRSWAPVVGAVLLGFTAGALVIGLRHNAPEPAVTDEPTQVSIRTLAPARPDSVQLAEGTAEAASIGAAGARQTFRKAEEPKDDQREAKPERAPARPSPAASGVGAVTVNTDSEVETFVYLNGGSLLGRAPLRATSIPAGRQTLVFWSPSVGGRSTRRINMRPGQNLTLTHSVAARDRFAPLEGG